MPKLPQLTSLKRRATREGWGQWIRSEADERALLAGMVFDQRRVNRVENFGLKLLRLCEGPAAGTPFTWMDWQREDLFGPLFGWIKPSADHGKMIRRYDRVYCEVAKKNGKSPTGAFIGLYMLCGDEEPGAKVFSASTTREQAGIVHNHAVMMAEASPRLMDLLDINKTTKTIAHPESNSTYRALASMATANEGLNSNAIICDELHAWYGRDLWDCLKWAFASRAEPILFSITTAGDSTESVCYEQHSYAKSIAAGDILDLGFLGLIYAAGENDKDNDPKTWAKANPSLGITITLDRFKQDYDEAKVRPSTLAAFRRYRLNRWGCSDTAWLPPAAWDSCADDYTPEDLEGHICWAGLDLATVRDLSAFVLVFPGEHEDEDPDADPYYRMLAWHWLPEATAEEYRNRLSIDEWVARGWLEITPGDVTDFGFIRRRILEVNAMYDLREIAFDIYKAEQFTAALENEDGIPRAEFPQTIVHFAEPTSECERLICSGRMLHNTNGLLSWQARHVEVRTDANGNKRPIKPKPNDVRKVDGMVAMIMAFGRAHKQNINQWPDADDYDVQIG